MHTKENLVTNTCSTIVATLVVSALTMPGRCVGNWWNTSLAVPASSKRDSGVIAETADDGCSTASQRN